MFTLRCTKKLLTRLKVKPDPRPPPPTTKLGDWCADVLNMGRERLVLCVSELTLLPVIVPAIGAGVDLNAKLARGALDLAPRLDGVQVSVINSRLRPKPERPDPKPLVVNTAFVKRVEVLLRDHLTEQQSDVWHFSNAPWATVKSLAAALGEDFLNGQYNKAPTPKVSLKATAASRRSTEFGGYVVWPPREDYRVNITSVTTPKTRVPAKWKVTADESVPEGRRLYLWWD